MKRARSFGAVAFAAAAVLAAPMAWAAGGNGYYASFGGDYSSGTYGQPTRTTIWDAALSAGFKGDLWSFRITAPYLHVSGPSNVIPGIGAVKNTNPLARGLRRILGPGGVVQPPAQAVSGTASGMGDVTAQATLHALKRASSQFELDVTGRVQFGTADANKGLGTGQNNYGIEVDAYKGISRSLTAFGGVGYTDLGSSSYIQLRNVVSANAGLNASLDANDSAGIYVFYQQRPTPEGYARGDATLYYNHKIDHSWSLQGYMLGGFLKGSPDYGIGASVTYRL